MAVTQITDTNNLLAATNTNATSKYMSKTSDTSDFSNIFEKANKTYSQETSSVKSDDYSYKSTEKQSYEPEDAKNELPKENAEAVAGETSENNRLEQKIQDNKKAQNNSANKENVSADDNVNDIELSEDVTQVDNIQENVLQSVEDILKIDIKKTSIMDNLQTKELASEIEKLVSNIDMSNSENIEVISAQDVPNFELEQLKSDVVENLSNLEMKSSENVMTSVVESAPKKDLSLLQNNAIQQSQTQIQTQTQTKNVLNTQNTSELATSINTNVSTEEDGTLILEPDAKANMIKTENDTPLVKVDNDNSLLQNVKLLSDEDKQNVKSILDSKNINQQVTDDLDVRIKSVVTTSGNENNSSDLQNNQENQTFVMQQNVQEQAVRFELEANSDVKTLDMPTIEAEPTLQATESVSTVNELENINSMQNLNMTKNVNTQQNVQPQSFQAPKELNSTDIMSQIDKQLDAKSIQDAKTTKVSIILRPENLGKLELELVSSKNGLEAKMVASSTQVKELLDKNLDALKDTLGSQGVSVNNVTIKVAETQKSSSSMFDFDQNQQFNQGSQKEQPQKSKTNFALNQDYEQDFESEQDSPEELYTATEQITTINGLNGRVAYKL